MSLTDQEAIDAALDNVELEHGIVHDDNVEVINDELPAPDPDPIEDTPDPIEDTPDDSPPGYMSYDEWIAAGKDADLYKGKKAYEAEYDRIQEIKGLKGDLTSLKDSVKVITDTNQQYLQQQTDTIRAQLESDLKKATDDDDVGAALDVQAKLHELNTKPPSQPRGENPVIASFRTENPLLDKGSSRFNPDYNEDVENIFNNTVNKVASIDPSTGQAKPLTEAQITRVLKMAKSEADKLHPNLFESSRNSRSPQPRTPSKKASAPKQTNYRDRLKGIRNPKNPNDASPALDMYDMLLSGGNKQAAEDYAKAQLGE